MSAFRAAETWHLKPDTFAGKEFVTVEFNRDRFLAAYRVVQMCDADNSFELLADGLHVFETLVSTNQTAWELVDGGALAGIVVIARSQTSGRGQWGRQWRSQPGGLYLSTVLEPKLAVEQAAQLTLCTARGIAQALREIPGKLSGVDDRIPVQLKWLNDLVLQGYKLGGILTETRVQHGHISQAVVGVGVNWANPVPETGINLQSFLENQPTPLIESLEMLAALTLHGLLSGYQHWQRMGIEAILPSYLELLAHRDRPIPIKGCIGTIAGITPTGELRVQLDSPQTAPGKAVQQPSASEILLKPGTINFGYPL